MVLLSAYAPDGRELGIGGLTDTAEALGWRVAARYDFASLEDLVRHAGTLPKTLEGFVIRFSDGTRLKVKGAEYRRIHAIVSRVTPLALWEAMAAGDDLDRIRIDVPEEYWGDFDTIRDLLAKAFAGLFAEARAAAAVLDGVPDRDVAGRLGEVPAHLRPYVFAVRKDPLGAKLRAALFRLIRPAGNVLPGYVPSFAMMRATGDE
jgi:RNA ligase